MTKLNFLKMHGCGNDFVVIDNRVRPMSFTYEQVRQIADRRFGIGCDQLVIMEASTNAADVFMRLYNADGAEVSACGNATRCVAWLIMQDTGQPAVQVETKAGVLKAEGAGPHSITVDMGEPHFEWTDIPLSHAVDTQHIFLEDGVFADGVAVNIGNPHAVFFVPSSPLLAGEGMAMLVREKGRVMEYHPLFPERANISVAQVIDEHTLKLHVWERGVGETLACGTAACATLVAANARGLTGKKADVHLPGGTLQIEWADNNHVWMTGPVAISFKGEIEI